MTDIFEGIEYRERKAVFPDWRNEIQYSEWMSIPKGVDSFVSHTQFRLKPVLGYVVTVDSNERNQHNGYHATIDAALEAMRKASVAHKEVRLSRKEHIPNGPGKQPLQHSPVETIPGNMKWTDVLFSGTDGYFTLKSPARFRIRPDHYFRVVSDKAIHEFDDVTYLINYINGQIRQGNADFKVSKVKY